MTTRRARRAGATAAEAALTLPVVFVFLFGIILGGHAVYRHQLVALQAREAARWASVRGGDYQRETGLGSPTRQQIFDQAVVPFAAGMDPSALTVEVLWVNKADGSTRDWDAAAKDVRSITADGRYTNNAVRVAVSYQWSPGILTDPVQFRSVCELPMAR